MTNGLIELLPMTRRSFIGSVIALAAAPAIVRASSIMQVQAYNWQRYVREVISYRIDDDQYVARWDILSPQVGQFHIDFEVSFDDQLKILGGRSLSRDNMYQFERKTALAELESMMRRHNVSPRSLTRLELPQGINWARHLG